jgi:hypothetical protein
MSQTADEQIRPTLDALVERLRASVADQVSVAAEQLVNSVEAARQAAVQDAVQQAIVTAECEVTARLTDAFTRREGQIKETARAEWFAVGVEQARAEAAVAAAARETEVQAAVVARDAEVQARVAALEAEMRASVVAHETGMRGALAARDAEMQAAAGAAAKATAALATRLDSTTAAHREDTARLLRAIRLLDDATSLSQALEALGVAAKAEADRFAVFLPKGDALRAWSHAGFPALERASSSDVPLPEAGVAADTIHTGQARQVEPGGNGRPLFAGVDSADAVSVFVAVPVTMNGQVIAVLCGEQADGRAGSERLLAVFEVIARHAARVLETLTALRLAQLGSPVSKVVAASPPQ